MKQAYLRRMFGEAFFLLLKIVRIDFISDKIAI